MQYFFKVRRKSCKFERKEKEAKTCVLWQEKFGKSWRRSAGSWPRWITRRWSLLCSRWREAVSSKAKGCGTNLEGGWLTQAPLSLSSSFPPPSPPPEKQVCQPLRQKTWFSEQSTGHQIKKNRHCANARDQCAVGK